MAPTVAGSIPVSHPNTFTYDGDGNRVKKNGCGSIAYWRNFGGDTLDEASTGGTMLREYVFFNGERIARRDVSTNNVYYFFSNHLGSTSLVTDANGDMPAQMESDYYPYGGEISITTGIQDQNYKFTGKERDSATGLDNFGARYYGGSLGRFMTPDWAAKPITVPYAKFGDPQSLNLYSYVENSPVDQADADGHASTQINGENMWLSPREVLAHSVDVSDSYGDSLESFTGFVLTADGFFAPMVAGQEVLDDVASPAHQQNATVKELERASSVPDRGMEGAGVRFEAFVIGGSKYEAYNWQQDVTRSDGGSHGEPANTPFKDNLEPNGKVTDTGLYFNSTQQKTAMTVAAKSGGVTVFKDVVKDYGGVSFSFHGKLTLIGIDSHGKQTPLWTGTWGFSVKGGTGAVTWEKFNGISQ